MQANLFHTESLADADPALSVFEPCVQRWFHHTLGEPTAPQREAWPRIAAFEDVLITAPTGSGKTLAAFLACLDRLWRDALAGRLKPGTRILYVSPLKALSNDVQKNLLAPLAGIRAEAERLGILAPTIEVLVRTGDTPSSERQRMASRPPHILITTPESLYLCLTAGKSRAALAGVETVIIDEIHALVRDKRGSHLSLSLERLAHLCGRDPQRIGLSATQKPLEKVAEFLTAKPCHIVRAGHVRPWNLHIEAPDAELGAVASHEMWGQIYDRILQLAGEHRTILCFTNTRKLAERVAHDLGERLGEGLVAAHHGSMARELRLRAEERLKAGELRIMVATASLELGIDIGSIDLVCQLGSPRSIAVLLQRVGRAGHHKAGISKGILFAMTRDELCECAALLWAVKKGDLDALIIPNKPLDVLAQQMVAMCVTEEWKESELRACVMRASPYRGLTDAEFEETLVMLCEGPAASRRGRALLHRDRVNGVVQARKMARMVAQQNGGAIPDTFTYPVIAEPEGVNVGTLDEDFAVESSAGDIFLLGSTSWRIQRVIAGTVRVENAGAQPPTVPFWRGEAPARTIELSHQVGELRELLVSDLKIAPHLWLQHELELAPFLAAALADYILTSDKMLGAMPSHDTVVAERFFDEAGGMQLIIHAPFGGRINRAWGMALRKRFCRSFDFELQAAAGDDGVLLSLGAQHSFALDEIFDFLSPNTVEDVLTQAVLQAPIFGTRFRWNATRALQLERYSGGQRVPPQLQRARSDDLLAAVFPAQVGCQDNHGGGDVELPDHPLVKETMRDCLHEAMDINGLKDVLERLRDGRLKRVSVDLPEPSPLAHQHLNSAPYTFLDEAPLEERRARAVQMRRTQKPDDVVAFGALDEDAIRTVIADAAPLLRDAAEVHDALLQLVVFSPTPVTEAHIEVLIAGGRAVRCGPFVAARERIPAVQALYPDVPLALAALVGDAQMDREAAAVLAVRGHMDVCGPMTASAMAERVGLAEAVVTQALITLETQGQLLRGRFWPPEAQRRERTTHAAGPSELEFCDRRLLQRIHRLTVGRLRAEIQPLSAQDFVRFSLRWHQIDVPEALAPRGVAGVRLAIEKLEGWEAPAAAWEHALLTPRVRGYAPEHLDQLCLGGEMVWGRLPVAVEAPEFHGPKRGAEVSAPIEPAVVARSPTKVSSVTFARRSEMDWLLAATGAGDVALPADVGAHTQAIYELLSRRGASFAPELASLAKLDAAVVEEALWDLLCRGLVTADDVDNLRLMQSARRRREQKKLGRASRGRWGRALAVGSYGRDDIAERAARLYLQRYGIVFRDLVVREPTAPRWRELLLAYRRMETRGEIRGGRFIAEVVGEQFALPDAVEMARAVRREKPTGRRVRVAAVDPLNLTTVVTQPVRVPRVLGEWVDYIDGVAQSNAELTTATEMTVAIETTGALQR